MSKTILGFDLLFSCTENQMPMTIIIET